MKSLIRSLCLIALLGGQASCQAAGAAEAALREAAVVAPEGTEESRGLASGLALTRHLLRSHSRDLVLEPVGSIRDLLFYTTTAATGLVQDTALDTLLVPALAGEVPPLAGAPGMDLRVWERRLDRMVGRPPTSGTVRLLVDGEAFFDRLVAEIEAAESSIRFRTYIFDNDDVALDIADRLKRRSREIPVEVVMDGIGSWGGALIESPTAPEDHVGPVSIASYLEDGSKVEVGVVGNAWLMGDHTKMFLFDDRTAFLGGMNIGREYRYDWHDLMVELTGPVVTALGGDARRASSERRWGDLAFLGRVAKWLSGAGAERVAVRPTGDEVPIRLLYTEPHDPEIYRAQLAAIRASRNHVYIENAYLADDRLVYALLQARRRGVDVRVVVPNRPDSELMNRSNAVTLNLLKEHGVRVYLYPGMSHVKAAIYDGWACLGTANFDRLSFRVNREVNIATSDPRMVDALRREIFERDFRVSTELAEEQPVRFADHVYERIVDVVL